MNVPFYLFEISNVELLQFILGEKILMKTLKGELKHLDLK
jgi:hypothetical protein